jgi:hypothetical protein
LGAKLPIVSGILDVFGIFVVIELLMLVLLNPLVKVAWHGWEVVETWSVDSVLILACDNELSSLLIGSARVKIHASTWLHGGGDRLSVFVLLSHVGLWESVAFNNLEVELDVRAKWDWLSSNWSPGEGSTISIV